MRIFVTGAGGHIGSAVVTELLQAGHRVLALARSDTSAQTAERVGAEVWRGDANDLDLVGDAARQTDGTIHLAFDNEAALAGDLAGASAADLAVAHAYADALAGSDKPFLGVGTGPTGDEQVDAMLAQNPRSAVAGAVSGFPARGIRSALVAIPPVVHSPRDRIGFVPNLIRIARRTGVSGYIDDGANHWPNVHTLDLSRLFRLALEGAPAGAQLYAAAEDEVTTREIAETIGRHLDLPSSSIAKERAEEHFGAFNVMMALDFPPMTSPETRALLGWRPAQPGLIEDLEQGHYFEQA